MADCSGIWSSTIRWRRKGGVILPQPLVDPDGKFTIDPHTGPTFTGQHHEPPANPTVLFNTSCSQNGPNGFRIVMHRLDMTVTPPEQFIYTGTGTIDPVTGDMVVTDGEVHVPGGPDPNDAGTWEASKPGGGGEEEEDEDVIKNKDRKPPNAVGQ
jgi:hypothetical protein